jgi:hypothetical protein
MTKYIDKNKTGRITIVVFPDTGRLGGRVRANPPLVAGATGYFVYT